MRSRPISAGRVREEGWAGGGEVSARFASPATRRSVDDDHQQQQQYRSSRTPTRSSSSTTPRRSVPFARDGSTKQALSSSSSGNWGRAAVDVPRIQIRAKSPGEGGGGRDVRPKSPWRWGGSGGTTPRSSSSTRTPPPRTFSALQKEGAGGGLHQQQRLSSRSPRSSLTQSHQKQRLVPSVVLRCSHVIILHPPSVLNHFLPSILSIRSLDDTILDDSMAQPSSSASASLKVWRPSVLPALS